MLYEGETAFQKIQIFENAALGRVLALDGIVQTTEADEFMYHEMLAHVPLFGYGTARRVLIIGGGDGGLLEEVLKHPIENVWMIEIDGEVVELCRKHLSSIFGAAFEDLRAELVIANGADYLAASDETFDLILVDSTDPVGPEKVLFELPFYESCRAHLGADGVLVTQNGVPFFQGDELSVTAANLNAVFARSGFYVVPVPTYPGGVMTLGWASAGTDLAQPDADLEARYEGAALETRDYTPAVHRAAFALPEYVADLLAPRAPG